MKQTITTLVFLTMLAAGRYAPAQTNHSCGSSEQMKQQMAQHPEMAKLREQQEIFTKNYVARHTSAQSKGTGAVYTIPVVVHVLYFANYAPGDVTDAQVQSQIDVLNQDFQLLNADAANVPAAFAGLKADCQIQFCLAKRDPLGNATTGIIHKGVPSANYDEYSNNAKFSAQGGDDAWPRGQYLNIWVVADLGFIYQHFNTRSGYSQFPGGPASTDGIVICRASMPNLGSYGDYLSKGRVATHMVGHWLNLEHLWGQPVYSYNNDCTATDYVADTPPQYGPNYRCPTFPHISCNNGPNGDLFMNYMDMTADSCMFMFTLGQKARMHAVLAPGGLRASLANSLGCIAPPACNPPSALNVTGITNTSAALGWTGAPYATSYTLQWKPVTGGTWTTVPNIVGTAYTLTGLTPATLYYFKVKSTCGGMASPYSGVPVFTTTGCPDNFEPNESLATARQIPVNVPVTGNIGTATDNDYFRFTTSAAAPKIKVLLAVPADYDLKLYSSNGTLLSSSAHTGTTAESIVYNAPFAGTYYVQVYGNNGANSGNCYSLLVQTSGLFGFKGTNVSGSNLSDKFTLYPNPTRGEVSFEYDSKAATTATVNIIDQSGRTCKTIQLKLAAGQNKPVFNISDLSAGFYFVRMTANNETVTTKLFLER